MKVLILIFCGFTSIQLFSQNLWSWQNPQPHVNIINDVFMVDEFTAYAVGKYGTIIKTTDGGLNWTEQKSDYTPFNTHHVDFTSVSFVNNSTGFAVGWEDDDFYGFHRSIFFRTTDGGLNWNQVSSIQNYVGVMYFINDSTGFISIYYHEYKLLKTTDAGHNWSEEVWHEYVNCISFSDLNNGTISDASGIYRTFDGGTSWIQQNSTPVLTVYSHDSLNVIAAGADGRIIKTSDAGETWNVVHSGVTADLNYMTFSDNKNGVIISSKNRLILRTTDGGEDWVSDSIHADQNLSAISVSGSNGIITAGISTFTTSDRGVSWHKSSSSLTSNNLNDVCFLNDSIGFAAGDMGTILATSDGGENWFPRESGTNLNLNGIYFFDENKGVIVGDSGIYLTTTNSGISWSSEVILQNTSLLKVHFVNSTTGIIVGKYSVVLKTTDAGITWTKKLVLSGYNFTNLSFIDEHYGVITGSVFSSQIFEYGEAAIILTTDGGETWRRTYSGIPHHISSTFFFDANTGVAGGIYIDRDSPPDPHYYTIIKTTDKGITWNVLTSGAGFGFLDIDFADRNNGLAVGTRGAIFRTTDGGINWEEMYGGNSIELNSVSILNSSKALTVGSRGVILLNKNTGLLDNPEIEEFPFVAVPTEFSLNQNYPNPFNPMTIISYTLPAETKVHLTVYDAIGREIIVLVNKEQLPGTYSVRFQADALSNGVYYYRISAGEFTGTKKMILIK
jgi:photosystem II stability/assembly factor-like uncharacterized protein